MKVLTLPTLVNVHAVPTVMPDTEPVFSNWPSSFSFFNPHKECKAYILTVGKLAR